MENHQGFSYIGGRRGPDFRSEWLGGLPPIDVTITTFHARNVTLFDSKTFQYPEIQMNFQAFLSDTKPNRSISMPSTNTTVDLADRGRKGAKIIKADVRHGSPLRRRRLFGRSGVEFYVRNRRFLRQ